MTRGFIGWIKKGGDSSKGAMMVEKDGVDGPDEEGLQDNAFGSEERLEEGRMKVREERGFETVVVMILVWWGKRMKLGGRGYSERRGWEMGLMVLLVEMRFGAGSLRKKKKCERKRKR